MLCGFLRSWIKPFKFLLCFDLGHSDTVEMENSFIFRAHLQFQCPRWFTFIYLIRIHPWSYFQNRNLSSYSFPSKIGLCLHRCWESTANLIVYVQSPKKPFLSFFKSIYCILNVFLAVKWGTREKRKKWKIPVLILLWGKRNINIQRQLKINEK